MGQSVWRRGDRRRGTARQRAGRRRRSDGGQGGYASIQQNQERTRGPFNKKTGIFSSSIAEAGQQKGDRKLYGWVDIDAFRANPEKVPDQKDAKK